MGIPTTNSHLLDGVGEFPPVSRYELEQLLDEGDRKKGLSGTALANWHSVSWERVKKDFELDGIDIDVTLSTDNMTLLRAAACFRLMADLYRRNSNGDKESHQWSWADWHADNYDRIMGRWAILMPHGRESPMGNTIPIFRA